MSYYYRKPNNDNYEDDIRNLNNKTDIIYFIYLYYYVYFVYILLVLDYFMKEITL